MFTYTYIWCIYNFFNIPNYISNLLTNYINYFPINYRKKKACQSFSLLLNQKHSQRGKIYLTTNKCFTYRQFYEHRKI